MPEPPVQATANHQRIPRYPGKVRIPPRTPSNDEAALIMAQLALQSKKMAGKSRHSNDTGDSGDVQQQEEAKQGNAVAEQQNTVDYGTASANPTHVDSEHEISRSDEESSSPTISWPEMPFVYGDFPEPRLPLKSMYDGTGEWPQTTGHGGKQYSWSNIGYPRDEALIVPDFEENTHIDTEEPDIMELADDISRIRFIDPKEIADGAVKCLEEDNRTIETFEVRGRRVCRIRFSDANAFGDGSPYSLTQVSKSIERKIDEDFGIPPDVQIERRMTAHILLSMAGQIGGRTDDYWERAHSLAQQQFYPNPILINDLAFSKMLDLVKKGCPTKAYNPYHQAQRNDYATKNGLLYKVENTDIIMVLDQSGNLILFQCSDVFKQLLTKAIQKLAVQSFETYSTLTPVPFPDMTRHGLHWMSFLAERPDLDFRDLDNDPRVAKSGAFHIGARCEAGDPNGRRLPGPTKDIAGVRMPEGGHGFQQLVKLRYSAFGACTELSKFFFQILEPELLKSYVRVADEVAKLRVPFETRSSGEPFLMRALLVNQMTYEYQDTGDWHHGFAFTLPVGDFTGGDLVLRELGLQIEAPPGCLQMFRSRELRHSITKWTGRRFACVNVTHEAIRRWALRSLGEEVAETPPSLAPSPMADCIDLEPEDVVPEDQRDEQMWASEDDLENSEYDGSEASLPSNSGRKRMPTSKHRAASSSDASAEASDENAGGVAAGGAAGGDAERAGKVTARSANPNPPPGAYWENAEPDPELVEIFKKFGDKSKQFLRARCMLAYYEHKRAERRDDEPS